MDDSQREKRDEKTPAAAASKIPKKKGRKVKPKGFPKRPLSGYNWFFKEERKKLLNLDFQSMGKEISSRWKSISEDERKRFDELAKKDAGRYKNEVQIYNEEQVLKARKDRELGENKHSASRRGNAGFKNESVAKNHCQSTLDNGAAACITVSTVRAMEEKNHPEAARRLSPQLSSLVASAGIPVEQNLIDVGISGPQQLNLLNLSNEMRAMQHQALRNRLALGILPQTPYHLFGGQPNDAEVQQQLQRQNWDYALALAQKRAQAESDSRQAIFHEMLLQRQQQHQQLYRQHATMLRSFPGSSSSSFAHAAGIGRVLPAGLLPSHLATPTMMNLRGISQPSVQQPLPSFQNPDDQARQGPEANLESILRRLGQNDAQN